MSDLSGDTKVMQEILQRLKSKATPALLRPSIAQQLPRPACLRSDRGACGAPVVEWSPRRVQNWLVITQLPCRHQSNYAPFGQAVEVACSTAFSNSRNEYGF